MTRLAETLAAIDQLHGMDPKIVDGTPAELSYALQMTYWLQRSWLRMLLKSCRSPFAVSISAAGKSPVLNTLKDAPAT
ncbi:hypothetical protein [Endozoicomonas atrinae]|uniref:hypothetical protein n=1 Tax=Endozoicomonas atrinae TaxID=1333660 RepID=UPI003B00AC0E